MSQERKEALEGHMSWRTALETASATVLAKLEMFAEAAKRWEHALETHALATLLAGYREDFQGALERTSFYMRYHMAQCLIRDSPVHAGRARDLLDRCRVEMESTPDIPAYHRAVVLRLIGSTFYVLRKFTVAQRWFYDALLLPDPMFADDASVMHEILRDLLNHLLEGRSRTEFPRIMTAMTDQ
jgi:hypothetical protein